MLLKQNHPQQPQLIAIWRTEPVFISQLSMANGWIFWTKKCKQNSNVPFWNIRTTSRCCMQGGRINTTRCSFLPPFSCHNIDPWPKTGRSLVTSAASVLLVLCLLYPLDPGYWLPWLLLPDCLLSTDKAPLLWWRDYCEDFTIFLLALSKVL